MTTIGCTVLNNAAQISAALTAGTRRELRAAGAACEAKTKLLLRQAGRVDTGTLLNSYHFVVSDNGDRVVIGTGVEYAIFNEFGTATMAPAPHLGPAFDITKRQLIANLQAMGARL